MYSLLIDTHDKEIILGLYQDKSIKDHIKVSSPRHHSDLIMPNIKKILKSNKISVNELNEIIVVNGPGSFTGVRLGVTIAKTLAYTLNITIKTITSLEVMMLSTNATLPIVKDVKGVYGAVFENQELVGEYFYKSNKEFDEFVSKKDYIVVDEYSIDFNKVYGYVEKIDSVNPHEVNALYIKVIEALK